METHVTHQQCHVNRQECSGPHWASKGFWSGRWLIVVFLGLFGMSATIGGIALVNNARIEAAEVRGADERIRLDRRLERIEEKLDRALGLAVKE